MKTCYTASDLHLLSTRSHGHTYQDRIEELAAEADAFVLAGDIFDFHWSTAGSKERTAKEAGRWLRALTGSHPGCKFHYLLGNHDHCAPMIAELDRIRGEADNFDWRPYYLRLGGGVFLHGDAANWRMTPERLERFRTRHESLTRDRRLEPLYSLAIKARVHTLCARAIFPRRGVAKRLHRYLRAIGQGPEQGVRNVYFGHTHRALDGYAFRGLRFHNCGAPIEGLAFNILRADIE